MQGYPFEAWGLAGPELLGLSAGTLEALGVWRLGHQELLLEAVEQLRALVSAGTHGCCGAPVAELGTWGHPGLGGGDGDIRKPLAGSGGTQGLPVLGGGGDMGTPCAGWTGGHRDTPGWVEGGTWGNLWLELGGHKDALGWVEGGDMEVPRVGGGGYGGTLGWVMMGT